MSKKLLSNFKKHIINKVSLLIFAFFIFTTTMFAQGATCGAATPLTINGTCDSGSITDNSQDTPNATGCSIGTFRREGWYTFTVPAGPNLNVTITANASDKDLFLQLISSSSSCTGLSQINCANANTTAGAQTETISTSLSPGIYYVKTISNGSNGDMNLTSICVTSIVPPSNNTCASATSLPCATTNLAGTTVGTSNTAHGTACSMANYGVWYTFVGNGQITTISSIAGAGYDHEMSISSGSCGTFTNLTCQDNGLSGGTESYTFTSTNGVNYYVYIAHYSSGSTTTGTFTISRTCTTPIANDNCASAINVPINPTRTCASTVSGTILGASDSGITTSGCGGTDDDDVWYSFVATSTTHHIELLNVAGSTTDLYHAVYGGTCGSLGSAILCSDPNTSMVSGLTPGNTYYLQIYSWGNTSGQNSTFDICISTDPLCTTPGSQATGFTAGTITSSSFPGTFSGTANGYLVIRSTSATPPTQPTNGVIYTGANIGTLGTGLTVVQNGTSTSIAGTGLTGNTRYYYYIYNYNNTACSGGPLYNASGPLTGNAVTCPETPSPVSTLSTLTSINFSWPSSLGGGTNAVTYELQVTTDAGYTANVAGSPFTINNPTISLNVTGLSSNTTFYYRIRANNGCWSTYTTGTAFTGYCSYSTSTSTYWISNFNTTLGSTNINRNSTYTAGGYANYSGTDIVTQVLGQSFNFSTTMSSSSHGINIYVDWNNDLDFSDSGELAYASGAYVASATGTITIPASASIGNHRMRVVANYFEENPSACGSDSYTEAEDYTINVTAPPVCTGTPNAGTTTPTPNTGWPGSSYTVTASGYSIASNLTFQWQYSTNAGATWTNAGSSTSSYANYNATAPASGNVHWHLIVTCTNSGLSATSTTGIFTTMIISDVLTGCPNVVTGGLGLSGADPAAITCSTGSCVDLEANFLDLGSTTNYTVEAIQYNPPIAFNGLTNPVSVNTDDVWSPQVNLPFNFCFYGNTYDKCLIGSNGVVTFDLVNNTAGGSCDWSMYGSTGANLPISGHSALIENAIFGVFHDINPSNGGQVGWQLITLPTGCRALVVSWYTVPMFSNDATNDYTGMMVLYENSNIIEVYVQKKRVTTYAGSGVEGMWNDGNAVIGVQNSTGTLATVPPGRNVLDPNWTSTNEAWRFVPSGASIASLKWYEGAGVTGTVVGTTPTINVCPTATTTYTAEVTYTLCNGATLKETDQTTVTVTANKTWNGSAGTDWNTASNWTPSGVPTATEGVLIPNTANKPILSSGANALACSINIQSGSVLTINPNYTIKVTNAVTVAAGGSMIIEDDASLVQVNNVINSGNINYKRTANIKRDDYVYWSSPVAGFSNSAISPGTSLGYQYKWTPTIASNTGQFGNWAYANESMIAGKGYIVRGPSSYSSSSAANYTATFVGVPNNGNISTPISRGTYNTAGTYSTGVSPTPGTKDDDNWNLVGNPYPSSIDAIKFLTLNTNIAGFINIWTHGTSLSSANADPFYNNYAYNYSPADYITYNSTGTSSGPIGAFTGAIGGGQGFFVSMLHGSAAATENLNFNNTLRTDGSGNPYSNTVFFRTSNQNPSAAASNNSSTEVDNLERNRFWFDLVSSSGSSVRSLLGYIENATDEKDRLFDAFTNEKLSFNVFSQIDDELMLIQGRKLPFDINDKVKIGVSIPQDGLYKIALSSVDGLFLDKNQNIYLEDKLLNVIFNLKDAPYSFMDKKGIIKDRFVIRYTKTKSDNITEVTNQLTVFDNNTLNVESSKLKIKDIIIFDTLGKLLLNKNNVNNTNYQINNLNRTNSLMIVKVTLEDGSEEIRKVIY